MTELHARVTAALAGRYQVERELGRGGTATVYLAQDLRHGRPVAVKVLYPELAASLGPERFLREVEIAASLSHPHILPLHDSGEADGFLYYVMPYVEGESLRHRLQREIQMPVEEAVRIAREIAEALAYAHERGIVHRDIKPENILLEGEHAVVADFGVARAIESASSDRLTETGLAVGTAVYMSPEQAAGTGRVDGRSDIYSLGCVLYEMLAGEPPFGGGTPQAVIAKHMQAPVPKLGVVRPSVSGALQGVISKTLAKVPADRYAKSEELVRALATVPLTGVRRGWWRVAIAAGSVIVLAAVALSVTDRRLRPDPSGSRASPPDLERPRIAVMYFDDTPGDSSLRHIADGVTEELIYELSGVNAFQVISRKVMQAYRGRQVPLDSVIAKLDVNLVVDGTVQRSASGVRVRVQLINALTDTYLDSLSLERTVSDSSRFTRDAAQEIAARLRRAMGREVRLRDAAFGTATPLARDLARRAQGAREDAREIAESRHSEDVGTALAALARADSLLILAAKADPTWGRPWVDRGWIALDRAQLAVDPHKVAFLRGGLRLADEAVRRNPGSPDALELRGTVRARLVSVVQTAPDEADRVARAEADLRSALDRDSTLTRAWATLGNLLWSKGSIAEAAVASRRALREDTYFEEAGRIYLELFFDDLMLSNFPVAAEWCRRGRLAYPGRWHFVDCELTLMRHDAGTTPNPDSAWKLVRTLEQLDPPSKAAAEGRAYYRIYRRVVAATISARAGRRDIARAEITQARQATRGDSTLSIDLNYDEAYLRLVLGERARAEALLREYIRARPLARDYLVRDPLFAKLNGP